MSRIASGEIPVRDEDGFLFVDVAPYGPRVEPPNRAPQDRPPTYTAVTIDDDDDGESDPEPTVLITDEETAALILPSSDDTELGPEDDTASVNLGDWRAARRKAGRTRVPPPPPRRLSA